MPKRKPKAKRKKETQLDAGKTTADLYEFVKKHARIGDMDRPLKIIVLLSVLSVKIDLTKFSRFIQYL